MEDVFELGSMDHFWPVTSPENGGGCGIWVKGGKVGNVGAIFQNSDVRMRIK